jgi:hypothetical protein
MSISQTATKKDKKHGIQRRFQDALARFQVEEPARLLNRSNRFLTRNLDAHKAGKDIIVK